MNNYIILHGSFGSKDGNWFPWLKGKIEEKGLMVEVPQMPVGVGNQNYENWEKVFSKLTIDEDTTIIAHSSAPVFVCKYLINNKIKVKKLIFVCGFNNYFGINEEYDAVNGPMYIDNYYDVKKYCDSIICYYSDNDPYVKFEVEKEFADNVSNEQHIIKNGGHINAETGYTEFEDILQSLDFLLKRNEVRNMRIGIDIDDTTVVTVKSMIKYADLFDTQVLGRSGTNGNLGLIKNRYYLKVLYGWDDKTKFDFFNMYYKNVLEECEMKEDAVKVINSLKDNGNEIYFITARLTNIDNCDTLKITQDTLKDINYDNLLIHASDKLKACQESNIDIFIEDSYDTCKELEEHGIKTFLMTTKMNENIDAGTIERVHNWKEIEEKVNNYINKK